MTEKDNLNQGKNIINKVATNLKRVFKRYWGLVIKELKVLVNDKVAMLICYALPIVAIVILATGIGGLGSLTQSQSATGFAGRGSKPSEPPVLGIIDEDNTNLSHQFINLAYNYQKTGYCSVYLSNNGTLLYEMLGKNEINAIIIINPLFQYNLSIHFPALLTIVFDSLDTMHLTSTEAIVSNMVDEFKFDNNFTGVFDLQFKEEGVPQKGYLLFVAAPLFFPMILFSLGSLTATQSIVSDVPKDRMVLTPTNKYEMLAAKATALQIIMIGLIVVTVGLSMAFGLSIRGSIWDFFWMLFFIALSGVIWGLFVSSLAKVPLNALQYFIFVFLFQFIVLLFLENPNVLRWIPIFDGRMLLMNVTLRGESILWNLGYLRDILIETGILYVITQIIFNKRKNML